MARDLSFLDEKPHIATEKDVKSDWGTDKKGFRCRFCGHKFAVGDTYRWVLANFKDSPSKYGNFFVCTKCDGPDVLERAAKQEDEARQRFWWYRR